MKSETNPAMKPAANANMKSETTNPEPAITKAPCRVLKIASCPSLSGKSTLTYHIGCEVTSEGICTAESDPRFRVVDNSNIGFFSQEWVPLSVIQGEFDKVPAGQTITSFLLHALFRGKSVNTPAFLFAVLKNEGLVQPAKDKQRHYERMDPKEFLSAVEALIASKVELKWDEPAKSGAKSTKPGAKAAKVDAKPTDGSAKTDASALKIGASPSKIGAKPAKGVDIAAIVEVINAKVDAKPQQVNAKAQI
jgi:hypothetical protein